MEEFGAVVFFMLMIGIFIFIGFIWGYGKHDTFVARYECKDERIVDHEVVCYRYELKEKKQ